METYLSTTPLEFHHLGLPPAEVDYKGWPSPFDDSGVQYAWDSTSLGLLKTCARKYQLSMVLNWQPKRRSHHLEFGIYYHSAIEAYEKLMASKWVEKDGLPCEDISPAERHEIAVRETVRKALTDSYGYEPGVSKYGKPITDKTRFNLIRALVWYFEQFGLNDPAKTVILDNGRPAVELSFRFEIGRDIMLSGHLDRLVDYGDFKYVMDHKTTASTVTGASAKYFFQGFSPDNQMSLYSVGAAVAFHTPVKGVIIDAAQIAVGFSAFNRDFTYRTKRQLQEFLEGIYSYRALAESYHRTGFWPMNETACGNYGGCQFRDICSKDPAVRERFLRTDFTQDHPWNPLEPR